MHRHPLDPVALVTGAVTLLAGLVALLHQAGAFHLGVGSAFVLTCLALGLSGGLYLLVSRRSTDSDRGLDVQSG